MSFSAIGNLFIAMPCMSGKLKLSEPMMLVVILSFETISHFTSVFVTELWQFYLTQIIGACLICKFSVARSMLSKVGFERCHILNDDTLYLKRNDKYCREVKF